MTTHRARGRLPLVAVLLGTGRHRFERLVRWAGELASVGGCTCFVQHDGTGLPSMRPSGLEGVHRLGGPGLGDLLDRADVVVTSVDLALIADARDHGHLPVVVPRQRELGEHGARRDERRAAQLARTGFAVTAATQAEFETAVHRTLVSRGAVAPVPLLAVARPDRATGVVADPDDARGALGVGVR